jgi:hypothetical protein
VTHELQIVVYRTTHILNEYFLFLFLFKNCTILITYIKPSIGALSAGRSSNDMPPSLKYVLRFGYRQGTGAKVGSGHPRSPSPTVFHPSPTDVNLCSPKIIPLYADRHGMKLRILFEGGIVQQRGKSKRTKRMWKETPSAPLSRHNHSQSTIQTR